MLLLSRNSSLLTTDGKHRKQRSPYRAPTCLAKHCLSSVQVNNLSTSLLALLLLPRMLETADKYNTSPRLVVVASEVHYWAVVDKDLLEASNPIRHYGHKEDLGST